MCGPHFPPKKTPEKFLIFVMKIFFYFQIGELKPATSYIFLVRAENSHGLSIPSAVSSVVKTLGAENGLIPQSELSAARNLLSGKVSGHIEYKPKYIFCIFEIFGWVSSGIQSVE